jgi:hypothetical protein
MTTREQFTLIGKLLVLTSITINHVEATLLLDRVEKLNETESEQLEHSVSTLLEFFNSLYPVTTDLSEELTPSESVEQELSEHEMTRAVLTEIQKKYISDLLLSLDDGAYAISETSHLHALNLSDIECTQFTMSLEEYLDIPEIDSQVVIQFFSSNSKSTTRELYNYLENILNGELHGKL